MDYGSPLPLSNNRPLAPYTRNSHPSPHCPLPSHWYSTTAFPPVTPIDFKVRATVSRTR